MENVKVKKPTLLTDGCIKYWGQVTGGRIRVENGKSSFECQSSDIMVLGKVITQPNIFKAWNGDKQITQREMAGTGFPKRP